MTEEQKAKKAEKQAKRREYFEKKRQERLENGAKEEESGKEANGDSPKESQWRWSIVDAAAAKLMNYLRPENGLFDIFVLVLIFCFEFCTLFYTLKSPHFLQIDYV